MNATRRGENRGRAAISRSALSRRELVLAGTAVLASGCFGEFAATRALWGWNAGVGNKWLQWLVFLALAILPVYELFVIADVFILNTIEFFAGENPISGGSAGETKSAETADGSTVQSRRTPDPNLIRHEVRRNGKLERVVYVRKVSASELLLLDANMRVLTRVRLGSGGDATLLDVHGKVLYELTRDASERAQRALLQGRSAVAALQLELAAPLPRVAIG